MLYTFHKIKLNKKGHNKVLNKDFSLRLSHQFDYQQIIRGHANIASDPFTICLKTL